MMQGLRLSRRQGLDPLLLLGFGVPALLAARVFLLPFPFGCLSLLEVAAECLPPPGGQSLISRTPARDRSQPKAVPQLRAFLRGAKPPAGPAISKYVLEA